jgi:hypothetical protein
LYVTISLVGVLGVLEIQSAALKSQEHEIVQRYTKGFQITDEDCDRVSGDDDEPPVLQMRCNLERSVNDLLRNYNHARAKFLLDALPNGAIFSGITPKLEIVRSIHNDMERNLYSYFIDVNKHGWLQLKILGFYVLLVGVAIKLAKTSAEVFRWHL